MNLPMLFRIIFSGSLSPELQTQDLGIVYFINTKENHKVALEIEGIFRTSTHTASAFDTIRLCTILTDFELHGADFIAFAAVNAFFFCEFQRIFLFTKQALSCSHWTKETPGSWAQVGAQKHRNCGCDQTHSDKHHSDFLESIKAPKDTRYPVSHKTH